ncbi:hypothetical protein SK128_023003, partial [Halocaridina rubra]
DIESLFQTFGYSNFTSTLSTSTTATTISSTISLNSENRYECPHCPDSSFAYHSSLQRHLRSHSGERPFQCPYCQYAGARKEHLLSHLSRRHVQQHVDDFSELACESVSTNVLNNNMAVPTSDFSVNRGGGRHGLTNEVKDQETPSRTSKTSLVRKDDIPYLPSALSFSSPSSTTKIHHCPSCSYTTTVTTNLRHHLRTHTGEKPFTCHRCPFQTTTRSNLNRHMLTHTGEKPFSCSLCPYRASQKEHIKAHMFTHLNKESGHKTIS